MSSVIFDLVWPGGNTTAIVRTHVPANDYAPIAKVILQRYKELEQVGFLLRPYHDGADGRLAMMGGEFCGNATRSAAFLLGAEMGKSEVRIEIPGLEDPVEAHVGAEESAIRLPMDFCRAITPCPEGAVVDLQGIRHVVIDRPTQAFDDELLASYKADNLAVGLIRLHDRSIDPHVWVRETDTFYHETACGSGTIASALYLHRAEKGDRFTIRQPSGSDFTVSFAKKGRAEFIELAGPIKPISRQSIAL